MVSPHLSSYGAVIAFLLLFSIGNAYPIEQKPLKPSSRPVACDNLNTYTTEWFLLNTLPQFRQELHNKALFYTRGTSRQARQLACNSNSYVTLWDIWPAYLYDNSQVPSNRLRCIHNDRTLATTFYENMSQAYARMARQHATIMHSFDDFASPPMDGIWGRVELPAIEAGTDIFEMRKINEDRSLSDVFTVPHKAAQVVFEVAMRKVQGIFRTARATFDWAARAAVGDEGGSFGSCAIWDLESDGFLDSLF